MLKEIKQSSTARYHEYLLTAFYIFNFTLTFFVLQTVEGPSLTSPCKQIKKNYRVSQKIVSPKVFWIFSPWLVQISKQDFIHL